VRPLGQASGAPDTSFPQRRPRPLQSVGGARPARHNLPAPLTTLVGRSREIAEVRRLLEAHRLVTLFGTGGVGKTRLATAVAAGLVDAFRDGVWLVELAALADPTLVPRAVARTLGVPEQEQRSLEATVADALRSSQLLLVVDNCEHLIAACAAFADGLLRGCPELSILATSREPLGVPGELCWRVPSLSLPDAPGGGTTADVLAHDAARLFVDRAAAVLPDFALTQGNADAVADICRRLDGIPLAIELAAGRVRTLTAEQIAARLDDRFVLLSAGSRTALPRQQTLRATVDWSYGMLTDEEQALLRRLAVFAGGWTLEAAEVVGGAADPDGGPALPPGGPGRPDRRPPSDPVLDRLARLVDRSLVVADTGQSGRAPGERVAASPPPAARYRLLETLRQYAWERLLEETDRHPDEVAAAQRRHATFFLRLAEEAEHHLRGHDQRAWLERLEVEHDNLRSALAWSLTERGDVEAGLRLCVALWWFWWMHGHAREGQEWIARLLASPRAAEHPAARGRALSAASHLASSRGDHRTAELLGRQALAILDGLGDRRGAAWALTALAIGAYRRGDLPEARVRGEQGLALFRAAGDRAGVAWSLSYLGLAARDQGDFAAARALLEEGTAIGRELGDAEILTRSLLGLAFVDLDASGDYAGGGQKFRECLALAAELRHPYPLAYSLEGLAGVAAAIGQPERAIRLAGAAAALRTATDAVPAPQLRAKYESWLEPARRALGDDAQAAAWAEGQALALDEAVAYGLSSEPGPPPRGRPRPDLGDRAFPLTEREREVATLIAEGLTNRQIAARLVISERTADAHVRNILGKLELTSRAQVVLWAVEHGLSVDRPGRADRAPADDRGA
jgi:predicted ATPase/DNA-binding CsgD family transcriptional regulator